LGSHHGQLDILLPDLRTNLKNACVAKHLRGDSPPECSDGESQNLGEEGHKGNFIHVACWNFRTERFIRM
jgi:hypothetical protein